ncbi:MAG: hypothetical protein ACRDPQ_20380 [Nocardioidaceae bacterium]
MTAWRRLRERRDETGTALIEFIWLGLLLLVPLVYIMLTVFDAQRGAFGASSASRAAGRAFVLAPIRRPPTTGRSRPSRSRSPTRASTPAMPTSASPASRRRTSA